MWGTDREVEQRSVNIDLIKRELRTRNIDTGFFYFDSIPSTNSWLKSEFSGTRGICLAHEQTAGRGRMDRTWISEPGSGLTFSVAWSTRRRDIPTLSLVTGVTLAETLHRITGLSIGLIWPNDLLVVNRKLCGILGECVTRESDSLVIMGVGLNVNQQDFPGQYRRKPVSLSQVLRRQMNPEPLFVELVAGLWNSFTRWENGHYVDLPARYEPLDLLRNRQVVLQTRARVLNGLAAGIDEQGRLRLLNNGEEQWLTSGEVIKVGD